MEHAKKYVLVDPMMYRPTLPEKSLSDLDRQIQSTLSSQMPDDEKAKHYVAALKRFKAYDKQPAQPKIDLDAELSGSLPPNQQYKAKKLMRIIKDNPDVDWSDKGELIYRQTLVPKSYVSDLVGDALATKRPVEGPIGWETFDEGLVNVPSSLVKRRKRKKQKWII